MRVRLLRENDDPKLLSDLERLAGREPAPIEDVTPEVGDGAVGAEGAEGGVEAGPLDDPFVRRFVQISVHLKRYAPFYAGAAVWALAMLLISPVGKDGASTDLAGGPGFAGTSSVDVATASADSAVADLNADAIGAPVFDNTIGAGAFSAGDSAFADFTESEFSAGSTDSGSSSTSPTFDDAPVTFDDTEFADEEPEGLEILSSGYASRTGGTPAEQNPANGALPIAATLGQDSKYSFIELSGKGTVLRLKESPDGAIAADMAVLKACIATTDWKSERGQAFDAGPKFDPACSTGARFEGVWSFDLSNFPADALEKGLVLTPGPGTGTTFQVNLEPFALQDGA